jgi:hypothetical protein
MYLTLSSEPHVGVIPFQLGVRDLVAPRQLCLVFGALPIIPLHGALIVLTVAVVVETRLRVVVVIENLNIKNKDKKLTQ